MMNASLARTAPANPDADFGPQLEGHFDFTIVFEQAIFSIGTSALLLIVSPLRIALLSRRPSSFKASALLWSKLVAVLVLLGLQLANLALWSTSSSVPNSSVAVAAAALSLVDNFAIGSLLYAENRYSYSPSILLSLYLSIVILLDIANVRSLFLRRAFDALAGVATAALAVKILILVLEEVPKRGPTVLKISQEFSSGFWNRSAFWWLRSTFHQGFTAFLQVEDLPTLDKGLDTHHLASALDESWKLTDKSATYCMAFATWKAFQTTFWAGVLPRLCYTGFSFAQPFLINTIVNFIGAPEREHSRGVVGGFIGATALVYLGIAFSRRHYIHQTFRLITAVRGGLVSLIFSKVVDLDFATAQESAAVTLMSTDIDGITHGLQKIHDIWASVIELGLGIYLLQRQVGEACFLIVIPSVLSSFATARVARGMGPARALWNSQVQKRVTTTSSTLSQIKGIKMMGLTGRISDLIQSLRVIELDSSKAFRMFFVWMIMIANLSDQIAPIVIIAAAVFWTKGSQGLSTAEAFTSLSVVTLVSTPIVNIIAAYPTFVAGVACFERIQKFMLSNERTDYRSLSSKTSNSMSKDNGSVEDIELQPVKQKRGSRIGSSDSATPLISIQNGSFSIQEGDAAILKDINLTIWDSKLTMIVGPVGSGKSTLLKAMLGEARMLSGHLQLSCSTIAYCDQTAWLRLGTVQDNILGPNSLNEKWYQRVLYACALDEDIAQLADGDLSSVGSGGNALSGGQKQRVALARAVYARSSVVFLDNVFSALDQTTSREVFNRLLGTDGLLRQDGTTVVLATHAVEYFSSADIIVALDENGTIVKQAAPDDVKLNNRYIEALQADEETTVEESSDDKPAPSKLTGSDTAKQVAAHELTRKTGDLSLYKFYLQSVGILLFALWLLVSAGYIFSGKLPQIWLRIWTEHGATRQSGAYFAGYLGFGLLCILFSGACVYFFMIVVVPKSAQHLHWLLLKSVLRAPLWFFTSTDISGILNRFSQDMTLVDQVLPMAVFTTTFDVYNVIAGAALIASGATYVAAIIPLCILAIYLIQKFYLRTSRQMRHLDLEAKSPLYRLFTETAAGIITVRAFGWNADFINENTERLEYSQKPYYTMYCIQRWLNVVLDVFVAAIAVVLVGFALGFSNTATQGSIGLALLNVMEFNQSLSMLINSWTGLETSLGAIARLKTFIAETKTEALEVEDQTPPPEWPQKGSIQLSGVTARYNIEDTQVQPAIRDMDLTIEAGQQVSIVGRTGSGKSSLMLTLLHMLEMETGSIVIDDLDISRIPREVLRARILTIPQDPVELPGSVRYNISQFATSGDDEGDDEAMQQSLARVGLWDVVSKRGGLGTELQEVGLSAGQKQLFSLARALFTVQKKTQNGGIMILDEPTSSMDEETDMRMRKIVTEDFAGFTILTISHHADAAKDADVAVHIQGGRVAEVIRRQPE